MECVCLLTTTLVTLGDDVAPPPTSKGRDRRGMPLPTLPETNKSGGLGSQHLGLKLARGVRRGQHPPPRCPRHAMPRPCPYHPPCLPLTSRPCPAAPRPRRSHTLPTPPFCLRPRRLRPGPAPLPPTPHPCPAPHPAPRPAPAPMPLPTPIPLAPARTNTHARHARHAHATPTPRPPRPRHALRPVPPP